MASTITPPQLFREITEGTISELLDIRSRDDFAAAPIEGRRPVPTRNVPVYDVYDDLEREAARTPDGAVVVCGQGNGSDLVADELAARGRHVRSLVGGADAWARFLAPVEIPDLPGDLRAWQLQRPAKGCLSYVVGVPGQACMIVDPSRHPDAYLELAATHEMRVTHVVDTHVHADHLSGGPELAERVGAAYHLPPEDTGGAAGSRNRALADGDRIALGSAVVDVMAMHLPGHTPGTTALLVSGRLLLVGDTIFVRGLGRPDLTGRAEELARDLFASVHERLEPLPAETVIAPAHWSAPDEFDADGLVLTTIGEVFRATLLSERAVDAFVAEIVGSLPPVPATYDTIRLVNSGLLAPSADELDDLDVGKNQCAAGVTPEPGGYEGSPTR